jgi:hypothetical protein
MAEVSISRSEMQSVIEYNGSFFEGLYFAGAHLYIRTTNGKTYYIRYRVGEQGKASRRVDEKTQTLFTWRAADVVVVGSKGRQPAEEYDVGFSLDDDSLLFYPLSDEDVSEQTFSPRLLNPIKLGDFVKIVVEIDPEVHA